MITGSNIMENQKINVHYGEAMLKDAKFIKSENYEEKSYQVFFVDRIKVDNVTDKSFDVIFSRTTNAKEPFYISVTFEMKVTIGQNEYHHFNGDLEKMRNFASARKVEIVNSVSLPARASLLIASMVREFGAPLITPPLVKEQ